MKTVIHEGPYNRSKWGLNILIFASDCRGHQIKIIL